MMDEQTRERIRTALEYAVYQALGVGLTPDQVREEVEYAIESFEA